MPCFAVAAIYGGEQNGSNQIYYFRTLSSGIITEWLPTSGYEYGSAPDIEVYLHPDPNDARYEVWIPVVKKN